MTAPVILLGFDFYKNPLQPLSSDKSGACHKNIEHMCATGFDIHVHVELLLRQYVKFRFRLLFGSLVAFGLQESSQYVIGQAFIVL